MTKVLKTKIWLILAAYLLLLFFTLPVRAAEDPLTMPGCCVADTSKVNDPANCQKNALYANCKASTNYFQFKDPDCAASDVQNYCASKEPASPPADPAAPPAGPASPTDPKTPPANPASPTPATPATPASPTPTSPSSGGSSFSYKPMENIPGYEGVSDFPSYLMAIYNFGIWTIVLAALLMIGVGAYIYITSGGNTSQMGKGKSYIEDALIGVLLALVSYLLLYTINPELTKFKPLSQLGTGGGGGAGSASDQKCCVQTQDKADPKFGKSDQNCKESAKGGGTSKSDCEKFCVQGGGTAEYVAQCKSGCKDPGTGQTCDSGNLVAGSCTSLEACGAKTTCSGGCTQVDAASQSNSSGIDPKIVKSIVAGGEGCNKKLSTDGKGSCGYSQALPATRVWCGNGGSAADSCKLFQDDIKADINCAAKLIKSYGKTNIRDIACRYNYGHLNNCDCAKTTSDYCGRVEKYYNNCK